MFWMRLVVVVPTPARFVGRSIELLELYELDMAIAEFHIVMVVMSRPVRGLPHVGKRWIRRDSIRGANLGAPQGR